MLGKTILRILVVLTVGAILTIYISDMLRCILEGPPIPALELITFIAILAATISVAAFLSKLENTRINTRKQDSKKVEGIFKNFSSDIPMLKVTV